MNPVRFALPLLGLLALAPALPAQTPPPGYTLVWDDEFDGPDIDKTKWTFAVGGGGFGNNEMQWYSNTPDNARIEDGKLVIETRKQKKAGWPYTSAKLQSRAEWAYGYFEVRAKLPAGTGSWPAVWMLPRDSAGHGFGWPDSGELDLMEEVGFDPGVIHFTAHTGSFNHKIGTQKTSVASVPDALSAFHTYGLEWTPEEVRFLLDGQVVYTFANMHQSYLEWPFDRPFYLILNTAAGGDWGGQQGIDNATLPWRFEVDWVRVFRADH
jgi:beta-glucanase (GH16 family)